MLSGSKMRLEQARERLESHDSLAPLRDSLLALARREVHVVAWLWRRARKPLVRDTAVAVSWLGNGVVYIPIAAIVAVTCEPAAPLLLAGGLAVAAAHLVYPWTKLACGRQRPCDLHAELKPRLAPLDRLSFPSGHAMSLAAALLPIVVSHPRAWPAAIAAWLVMAWSRVACGHHYPTDVVAGGLLGALIALPVTWLVV